MDRVPGTSQGDQDSKLEHFPVPCPSTLLDNAEITRFANVGTHMTQVMSVGMVHCKLVITCLLAVNHLFVSAEASVDRLEIVFKMKNPYIFPMYAQEREHGHFILSQLASEPALIFGLLSYAVFDLESRTGQLLHDYDKIAQNRGHTVSAAMRYKVNAISALTERFNNDETVLQPCTIWAVVCLLAVEVCMSQTD